MAQDDRFRSAAVRHILIFVHFAVAVEVVALAVVGGGPARSLRIGDQHPAGGMFDLAELLPQPVGVAAGGEIFDPFDIHLRHAVDLMELGIAGDIAEYKRLRRWADENRRLAVHRFRQVVLPDFDIPPGDHHPPFAVIFLVARPLDRRQPVVEIPRVEHQPVADLFKIVDAGGCPGLLPRGVQGRKQHRGENRNDCNYDQQLNKCEFLLHLFCLSILRDGL